ncbi:MAG: VWA domain-containing protein [Hyphomicrobiaceae bacterium]
MANDTSKDRAQGTMRAPAGADSGATAPSARPNPDARQAPAASTSGAGDVADFLERMKQIAPAATTGRGRLVFAMDATMSRQPTWDMALALQAEMFSVVREIGGLDVQLVFFRGAGECRASRWVADPGALARLMTTVQCRGGFTQIGKVLSHVSRESASQKVSALVYVGDCMEEKIDDLCGRAGELALVGVPVFLFQEGNDPAAAGAFREIATLTRGAYCRFDQGSAEQLRELLKAVAVYAAGGRRALERLADGRGGGAARRLLADMTRK